MVSVFLNRQVQNARFSVLPEHAFHGVVNLTSLKSLSFRTLLVFYSVDEILICILQFLYSNTPMKVL